MDKLCQIIILILLSIIYTPIITVLFVYIVGGIHMILTPVHKHGKLDTRKYRERFRIGGVLLTLPLGSTAGAVIFRIVLSEKFPSFHPAIKIGCLITLLSAIAAILIYFLLVGLSYKEAYFYQAAKRNGKHCRACTFYILALPICYGSSDLYWLSELVSLAAFFILIILHVILSG